MKNSTKFLDDLMKNDSHIYLIVDVTNKPTSQDWWRFESECLKVHFGFTFSECEGWWNTWFIGENPCNFILIEISIEEGIYNLKYKTETVEYGDLGGYVQLGIPCVMSFQYIYNKYIAEISPETLTGIRQDKDICFLSQEELDQLCGGSNIVEDYNPKVEPKHKLLQWLEDTKMKEIQKELQDSNYILKEENEILQDTIKDMEAQINKLNTILEFVWTMLENKIKEGK